ncbi:hypothetical protein BH23GEM9_BH23GEM9_34810 [soil metagenome]
MAKKKAPAKAEGMTTFYAVLAVVAVVGIGAIVFAMRSGGAMATELLDMSEVGDAGTLLQRARGETAGDPNAPVQIHVFSDYMCPACGQWAGTIEPRLKAEFVTTGKVLLVYYDFPLGGEFKHSFAAARAARCAGDQERFWEYHDHLFGTQRVWSYSRDTPVSHFMELASTVGLDQRRFESCLRSDQHADVVTSNKMLGETLGVGGTPTVFLNGRHLSQWGDYSAVREAVLASGGA